MGKREDNDSTNLPLVKVGRFGRVTVAEQGAEDRDAAAYKRLMALMKEEARPIGYLHGRGALDHDDLNYLREHIRAEEETEKLRQHSEKRAFAALKIRSSPTCPLCLCLLAATFLDHPAFAWFMAASKTDSPQPPALVSPAGSPAAPPKAALPNRQKTLLKAIVEVKPKRARLEPSQGTEALARSRQASDGPVKAFSLGASAIASTPSSLEDAKCSPPSCEAKQDTSEDHDAKPPSAEPQGAGLLGLAYDDSDEE